MASSTFKKGDIIQAKERTKETGLHYIIYYEGYSDSNFIGAMITHSKGDLNIEMNGTHFFSHDASEKKYKVGFNETQLVKAKLMKLEAWGPFKKVGQLTEQGIQFVVDSIEEMQPELWEDYLRRTAKTNH